MKLADVALLQEWCTSTTAVKEEVLPSFGPAGKSQLVITPTKALLLTQNSADVLHARSSDLSHKHPLARWLVAEMQTFHHRNGDGCATLVVILSAAMAAATDILRRRRLNRKLLAARLRNVLNEWTLARFISVVSVDDKAVVKARTRVVDEDFDRLHKLAFWSLGSHFTDEERTELAAVLTVWIKRSLDKPEYAALKDVVCRQDGSFDMLVIPTVEHAKSRVVEPGTFIISRSSLSSLKGKGMMETRTAVRFVLLAVDLKENTSSDRKVAVSSAAELVEVHNYSMYRIEHFVKKLARCEINLVLSTHELPDPFLSLFKSCNIFAVQQLRQCQADDLVLKTGVSPVHTMCVTEGELLTCSRRADTVREEMVGQQSFVSILGLEVVAENGWIPQVIVTGISPLLASHAKRSLHNALRMLKEAVIARPGLPILTTVGGSKAEKVIARELADLAKKAKEQKDICGEVALSILSSAYLHHGYCLVNPTSRPSTRALYASLRTQSLSGLEYELGFRSKDLPRGWRFTEQPRPLESLALKVNTFSSIVTILAQLLPIDAVVRSKKI